MGCCVQRSKFEGDASEEFLMLNSLPTYENISTVYRELELPCYIDKFLPHKKERIIFMIINLLRARPRIFMQQMNNLKQKCDMRQKPKNLVFLAEDVEVAIEMLRSTIPTHALIMSEELCEMCRE